MSEPDNRKVFVSFAGEVNQRSIARLCDVVTNCINDGAEEFHLALQSGGGGVEEALFAYNLLRGAPLKVTTYNQGAVYSAAVILLLAGEKRYCAPNAYIMVHPVAAQFNGTYGADHISSTLKGLRAGDDLVGGILKQHTTLPDNLLSARQYADVFINSDKAMEWGFVHGVGVMQVVPTTRRVMFVHAF